jgi:hypothetical protein
MSDPIAQLQRLGWEWRDNGVILSVQVSGKTQRVFVPLGRVWLAFDEELTAVGCPVGACSVGEPFTVGGLFSSIKRAVSGAAKSVVKAVVPKAVQKAAVKVASVAKRAANTALALPGVKQVANVYKAGFNLVTLPQQAALQLLQGKRIDKVGVNALKNAVKSAKTVAPYVQTVMSFVPGIGTGISAGLGGALALAEGQPISEAFIQAAKAAIPGGPAAQAAFSVATGAIQGKSIDTIALNALPIGPTEKAALLRGLSAAKALAAGQRVDQVLLDQALRSLPPAAAKAVQAGVAIAQAKNLQQGVRNAAGSALSLASANSAAVRAAQQFQRGARTPQVVQAMQRGLVAKQALASIVRQSQAGHPQAANVVRALQAMPRFFGSARP